MRMLWPLMMSVGVALDSAAAQAQVQKEIQLDIQSKVLAEALNEWAQAAGYRLIGPASATRHLRAPSLHGTFTAQAALDRLLTESGLTYEFMDQRTVAIRAPDAEPVRPADTRFQKLAIAQADPRQPSGDRPREAEQPPSAAARRILEEVIVSAQKREERLLDVPISISVLGGEDLDRSTVQGISEALGRVPGVSTPVALQGGGTQLSVRGVSAASPLFTGSSPIAYYLDSVPFALVKTAVAPDVDAYDLERVEVLRGPQGTLYGASALNGVVRVLTRDADLSNFELKARTLVSNTEYGGTNARADAAVNVPLIENRLAVRASASYSSLSGWIDKPNQADANDADLLNVRLKLNAQPTEKLAIGATAAISRSDYGAPSFSGNNRRYSALLPEPITTDYDTFGLKIRYDFSAFTLTSMTGYFDYLNDDFLDETIAGMPPGTPTLQTRFEAETFAQEVNLTSASSASWRWTLGGIYRDSKDGQMAIWPTVLDAPIDLAFHSESFAVFGELTRILLGGQVEMTAGLRYFEDRLVEREDSNFAGTPPAGVYGRAKFDAVSPRFILRWKPSDDTTFYASYSEGFRSGSHHSPAIVSANPNFKPTEPDNLTNYELGVKSSFLNEKLILDAAFFYIDWKDVQQSLRVPITNAVILSTVVNSESASGVGFEFAVVSQPIERLQLETTFSWNDLTFDSEVLNDGLLMFAKGDRLNFSPEFTVGASAGYGFPLGDNGFQGRLSISANYSSALKARRRIGSRITVSDGDEMLTGRTSFSVESPHRWTASLFVDNVTNEQNAYINNWLEDSPERDMRIRPRTIGVQLEYRF